MSFFSGLTAGICLIRDHNFTRGTSSQDREAVIALAVAASFVCTGSIEFERESTESFLDGLLYNSSTRNVSLKTDVEKVVREWNSHVNEFCFVNIVKCIRIFTHPSEPDFLLI